MKVFKYYAKTGPGDYIEGVLEGETASGVARVLVSKGLFPIKVVDVEDTGNGLLNNGLANLLGRHVGRKRLDSPALALLTRRLGDLLDAGLPMQRAIQRLHDQTEDKTLRKVLKSVAYRVRNGDSLSRSFCGYGSLFPQTLIGAIEAGETGGGLVGILNGLADLYEKEGDLKRAVKSALIYPTLVLSVSVITLVVLFNFLLPKLSVLYSDLGQALPMPTQILLNLTSFFESYGLVLFGFIIACVVGFRFFYAKSKWFSLKVASLVLKIPFLGRIIIFNEIVRFSHSLACLVGGGVPLMRGLQFATNCVENKAVVADLNEFGTKVSEGNSLSDVVSRSCIGESVLVMMLQVGEERGELAQSLGKACRVYERELDSRLKIITTIIEPVLIVFLGLVVGFIVFSMMLPVLEVDLGG